MTTSTKETTMHPIMLFALSLFFLMWAISQLIELTWPLIKRAIRLYLSL